MGQYAGNGGGGGGIAIGGDYQKYYQKYMAQHSGGDKGSSGSAASEEPKPTYMAQNAGGGFQAASSDSGMEKVGYPGGGYYQTYMNHYAGGAPPTPPGPSEQQNGGYQHYISQQSPGSGYYQTYYQQYMKKHTNASGCGDYLNYYKKYMAQYSGGAAGSSDSARGIAMAEAAECSTEKCLKAWRDNQEVVIKSTVPKAYQRCSSVSIEKEYEKNLARVKRSNASTAAATAPAVPTMDFSALIPPIAMAQAAACSTKECLKAWRDKQEVQIKSTVPKDVQHFALDSVEKEYEKNLARIKRASPPEPAAHANTLAASPLAMSSDTGHREGSAKTAVVERFRSRSSISIFGFCSLGLLLSITLYSRSRGCKTRRSQQRHVHLETDLGGSAEAWRNAAQKGERFVTSDDLENPYVNLVE
jgi:Zn ribbon nucleic-acid-binding protein